MMRTLSRLCSALALAGLFLAAAAPCLAAEDGNEKEKKGRWAETGRPPGRVITDRWGFYIGSYIADITTSASVGSGNVLGAYIQTEDQLGIRSDDTTVRAQAFTRFNPRHGMDFGYWSLKRNGSKVLDEDIEFQDKIYNVGASVDSFIDTSYFRVGYMYSMVNNERAEAGISAGLSTFNFDVGLSGSATFTDPNGTLVTADVSSEESIAAPVPTFGFFLNYAMRPRLLFKLRADVMDLRIGDVDGSLVDTSVGVEWYFSRHAGIGLASNTIAIDVNDKGSNPYTIDYKQRGWVGYFTFVFGNNKPLSGES